MSAYKSMNISVFQTVAPLSNTVIFENNNTGGQMVFVKSIHVCNTWGTDETFSIGVALQNEALGQDKQFLYKDQDLPVGNPFDFDLNIGLRTGDKIFMSGSSATIAINGFGVIEPNQQ